MAISERVQLLGRYENIPPELTISCISTDDELRYVGDESFVDLMLNVILPKLVSENVNFNDLLEIDFHWLCRCLRILSFGPIHTTNSIFCTKCHSTTYGEYKVNLNTIVCTPIPEDIPEIQRISKHEFIEYDKDIFFKLLTMSQIDKLYKDPLFQQKDGRVDTLLGHMCYMIITVGDEEVTPRKVLDILKSNMISADFCILRELMSMMADFGLKSFGKTSCPNHKCKSQEASFMALADDRYYVRPWELYGNTQVITIQGKEKTYREVRQQMYENILDEALFISRASESAVSADLVMTQPVFVRKKYVESFTQELKEREKSLKNTKKS